jgi:hypothetical protein
MRPANAKDQIDRLEEELFKAGQVSRNHALYQMGIYRLGARIFDLKKRGWSSSLVRTATVISSIAFAAPLE